MTAKLFQIMRVSIYLLLGMTLCASAQDNTNSKPRPPWSQMAPRERYRASAPISPAYRKEALQLVIAEANRVAQELNLPEKLPITETNLLVVRLLPPQIAQNMKAIGNITTSNYTYYVAVGNKLSWLERTHLKDEYNQLQKQYLRPMSQMNTNAAYQLATQFLGAASMDVKALNRDCDLSIRALKPEGEQGSHFVPVYWVSWGKDGKPIASVELLEPTKTLRQLRVNKSEYILRTPLQIANPEFSLSPTNAPMSILPPFRKTTGVGQWGLDN